MERFDMIPMICSNTISYDYLSVFVRVSHAYQVLEDVVD
jgi:hypothetical protein